MTSLIAGGMLFIACFYLGLGLRRYYRVRKELLLDFSVFLEQIEGKIRFLNVTVPALLSEGKKECKAEFCSILAVQEKNLGAGAEKQRVRSVYLNEKSEELMNNFFLSFGTTDLFTQLNIIGGTRSALSGELAKAEKDMVNKGVLCYKLSVLLGIALLIIVV